MMCICFLKSFRWEARVVYIYTLDAKIGAEIGADTDAEVPQRLRGLGWRGI